jgi:MFS family permease
VDSSVLTWFAIGLAFLVAFIVVEAKAKDPMIPLDLFRNRTFAVSTVATFFAVFGFSILIIFLPLWFQIVKGESTTASGYLIFPFLIGLIFSSVAAGLLVSRTGRYKVLLGVGMIFMGVGVFLFGNLRGDTGFGPLDIWMLIAGLGVGPTMAIFTLIVQNDVPFERLGTATSDLTLFRQIGTSVGLTMAFTLFRENLTWTSIHDSIVAALPAGVPASNVPTVAPAVFDPNQLISVGGSVSNAFAHYPPSFATGFYDAFSLAIAHSVWLGVLASAISFVAVLALKERPLRTHFHADQAARAGVRTVPSGSGSGQAAEGAE